VGLVGGMKDPGVLDGFAPYETKLRIKEFEN
jgi:hypothetical protein